MSSRYEFPHRQDSRIQIAIGWDSEQKLYFVHAIDNRDSFFTDEHRYETPRFYSAVTFIENYYIEELPSEIFHKLLLDGG